MATKNQNAVDPLNLLYYMLLGGVATSKSRVLIICALSFISMHLFNVCNAIQIVLWKNTENIGTSIQFLIMTLPSSIAVAIIVRYSKNLSEIKDITVGQFISIETRGIAFQVKIKKEAKLCILFSSIHIIVTICMVLSFLFCDKHINTLIFNWIQKIPLIYRWIVIIPLSGGLFCLTYIPNTCPMYMIYLAFHLRFQYHILMDYLKKNIQARIDIDNEKEQRECCVHLRKCVDDIAIIHSGFRRLFVVTGIGMVSLYVSGVPAMVVAIYTCFTQGVSVETNSFTFLFIVQYQLFFYNCCIAGQMIVDESENFYSFLCKTPWIHWNKSNRMILLTILIYIQKPLKVIAVGDIHLDYTLIIKMMKLSYTLFTLIPKLTKWEW